MANAPAGTCANDPTLDKCPKAKGVVKVDVAPDGTYALTEPATSSKARAAQTPPYCALRSDGPCRAAGYEQGDATNECYSAITRHELYAQLYKYYNGAWYMMASGADAAASRKLQVHPRHSCTALPYRLWQLNADAWVLKGGMWYLASRYTQHHDYCG